MSSVTPNSRLCPPRWPDGRPRPSCTSGWVAPAAGPHLRMLMDSWLLVRSPSWLLFRCSGVVSLPLLALLYCSFFGLPLHMFLIKSLFQSYRYIIIYAVSAIYLKNSCDSLFCNCTPLLVQQTLMISKYFIRVIKQWKTVKHWVMHSHKCKLCHSTLKKDGDTLIQCWLGLL